jgi:outer membrane protein TolC
MRRRARRAWLALAFGWPAGCAGVSNHEPPPVALTTPRSTPSAIQPIGYCQEAHTPTKPASGRPFADASELTADAVIAEVLARNPTLAQMTAAYQAAAMRYPQVTSLDDPMLGVSTAPGAWGSNQVNGGYRLDVSQKLPFPGKRDLRGAAALADARAAGNEVEDARLQLTESAAAAFFDFYLAERALEVNREALRLLQEFRETAEAQYKNNKAPQQDMLRAAVEIGRQRERQVTLERIREVAVARINTLMHLPPDAALPPPPKQLPAMREVPESSSLRETALANRPDLKALADRIASEQAAVELARKEFGPDVELMGAYDSFWQENALRAQLGVRVNLPLRLPKRHAAVAEAQARLTQRQAELAKLTDTVNFQVQEAAAQVRESSRVLQLYREEILPAAEQNVKSGRADYTTGRVPFVALIEAQRNAVELRDRYYEALAAYGRRLAALERIIGGPIATSPAPQNEIKPVSYSVPVLPSSPPSVRLLSPR